MLYGKPTWKFLYGTALDIRDRLLAGAEVETSVPGEYAVVAHTDQGETINLADMLEITRFEIGTSEEASGAAGDCLFGTAGCGERQLRWEGFHRENHKVRNLAWTLGTGLF